MRIGKFLPGRTLCAAATATAVAFGTLGLPSDWTAATARHAESRVVQLEVALTAANPLSDWYGFLADVADTIGGGYDLINGAATLAGIALIPLSWVALPILIPAGLLIATDAYAKMQPNFALVNEISALMLFAGVTFFAPVVVSNLVVPSREVLRDFRAAPPLADEFVDEPSAAAVEAVRARVTPSAVGRSVEAQPDEPVVAEAPVGSARTDSVAVQPAAAERIAGESAATDPQAVEPVEDSLRTHRRPLLESKPVSAASAATKSSPAKADSTRRASRHELRPTS